MAMKEVEVANNKNKQTDFFLVAINCGCTSVVFLREYGSGYLYQQNFLLQN